MIVDRAWLRTVGITAAALLLGGCYRGSARSVSASDVRREDGWTLVDGVPLIRQSNEHGCGAAALAMMLQRWGVASSDVDVAREIPGGEQGSIAAGALRDVARHKGLRAFLIRGTDADLARELALHRPVMVGLVQRYTSRSYAHYEVVVGINQRTRRVLMLDPGRGLREDDLVAFASEWEGAGWLTLVVVGPL